MRDRVVIAVAFPKPDYIAAIERAGATVHVLQPDTDRPEDVPSYVDGLLLTGGADLDPLMYGQTAQHPTVEIHPVRDAYQVPLAKAAMAQDLPILAICRGAQVLNVAAGGTLIQDLPSQRPSSTPHKIAPPGKETTHDVTVSPKTRLAAILAPALSASGHITVNSRHHQALDAVAPGFVVTALAPDGVIEAVERPDAQFCVAVQWHPEGYVETGEFAELFEALVKAARERRISRG